MDILGQRRLSLSRKKTRIGSINKGFHFLGIQYPGTQPLDNTNGHHPDESSANQTIGVYSLTSMGGGDNSAVPYSSDEQTRIVPHPRTLRKARENVKQMVADGVSRQRIKNYLSSWVNWWVRTSETWSYLELLNWYREACHDERGSSLAAGLIYSYKLKVEAQKPAEAAIAAG